jgi:uncharacterized protein YkwD
MKKYILFFLALAVPAAVFAAGAYEQKLESKIFTLINAERLKYGLKPFKSNRQLSSIAKEHSIDMAERNYTSHITPEGVDPSGRAVKAGFNIIKKKPNGYRKGVGENIYECWQQKEGNGIITPYLGNINVTAKKAVESWMNSPGHRANILNPDYTVVGTGVGISKDKKVKITQVFF